MLELTLFALLFVKHFFVDFPLQGPFQYQNKGYYGHLGGIQHSSYHALGTFVVFSFFGNIGLAAILALIDGVVHYHVDWAKVNINKAMKWGPTTHEQFWWLLGFDQLIHCLTYVGLVALFKVM